MKSLMRRPSRNTAFVILIAVLFLFILSFSVFIYLRPYAHPFWRHQPVAWAQVLPAPNGLIQAMPDSTQLSSNPPSVSPLPQLLKIRVLRVGASNIEQLTRGGPDASPELWNKLSILWKATPDFCKWACLSPQTRLIIIEDTQSADHAIIGTLTCTPSSFHTPIHEGLRGYTVNRLCIRSDYQNQRLCPHLLQTAFTMGTHPKEPMSVALFAYQLNLKTPWMTRLPFAPIAHVARSQHILSPSMLPDVPTDLRHQVVTSMNTLPRKCAEASALRVESAVATFEPTPDCPERHAHWAYVIANPMHTLISIEGTEWIHFQQIAPRTVAVVGTSYSSEQHTELSSHVLAFLKQHYAERVQSMTLVVPYASTSAYDAEVLREASLSNRSNEWQVYDAHDLHMYNYRLPKETTHIPYTMDVDIL